MATRKTAALVAAPAAVVVAHDDNAFIANLLAMDAKQRVAELLKLKPGEVAAIGGKSGALATSCYEVLSMMMDRKHEQEEAHQTRRESGTEAHRRRSNARSRHDVSG